MALEQLLLMKLLLDRFIDLSKVFFDNVFVDTFELLSHFVFHNFLRDLPWIITVWEDWLFWQAIGKAQIVSDCRLANPAHHRSAPLLA